MSNHTPWSENRHIRFLASLGATIIAVGLVGLAQAMTPFQHAGLSTLAAGVLVIGVAIALQELIFGAV